MLVPKYSFEEQDYCPQRDEDYICNGTGIEETVIDHIRRQSRRNRKPE